MTLSERRFRANPEWVAGPAPAPLADERSWGASLAGSPPVAVLHARDGSRVVPADFATAALFQSLRAPGRLPTFMERLRAPERERAVARLVYDGVVQVEKAHGSFADGVLARDVVLGSPHVPHESPCADDIDDLSRTALLHAARIGSRPEPALARRLYMFNATPWTSRWSELLAKGGVARWLGLDSPSRWRRELSSLYEQHGAGVRRRDWLQWIRRGVDRRTNLRHKVYVSPTTRQLVEAFPRVVEVCVSMDVPAFKVGSSVAGVLRSDKLVIHLGSEREMWAVVTELGSALAGLDAHGVPFSAPVDDTGLLSWAIDPPEPADAETAAQSPSWRTNVVLLLARGIAAARGRATETDQIAFALERVRLEGIEPVGWRPAAEW